MPSFTFGIVRSDVENALNIATVKMLFDDGDGTFNSVAFDACAIRGGQDLQSWLIPEYGIPLPADLATDPFLKSAATDFVVGRCIERHPEYAKQQGFGSAADYFERATATATRIVQARQRPTTIVEKPANVGGPVMSDGPRMYIPDANGRTHSGDF